MAHCSVSESTTLSVLPCYLAPLFTTKEHDTWNPKLRHRRVLMNCAHQTYGCIDDAPGISHSYKQLAKAGGNITLHFIHITRHHATHTNQKARKMIYYSHYWVEQSQANPKWLETSRQGDWSKFLLWWGDRARLRVPACSLGFMWFESPFGIEEASFYQL